MSGYLTSTSLPRVDELSTDPRVLGCHTILKEKLKRMKQRKGINVHLSLVKGERGLFGG